MSDLPETIGPYKIVEKLGQGGFATVYLAHASGLDATYPVALKALNASESYARFQREIETVANLDHPNIIRIFDTGEFENTGMTASNNGSSDRSETEERRSRLAKIWGAVGRITKSRTTESSNPTAVSKQTTTTLPYFTMEYVPSGTLRDRLDAVSRIPRHEAIQLIKQVGQALTYAHEQGIIHRDVNPNNILLDTGQTPTRPILTDFGLVKPLATDDDNLTVTVGLIGTFHYYAPEQWSKAALTPATDLYALAITFFEMLSGQRPFQGDIFHLRDMHLNEPLPSLASVVPELGSFFDKALGKATAKSSEERYATIADFVKALERANEDANDDASYKEIQQLIETQQYIQALEHLDRQFIQAGKYEYRDVPRLFWGLVYSKQHSGALPPGWSDSSPVQTKELPLEEPPLPPATPVTPRFEKRHAVNRYFIPLAVGLAMLIGAVIAPQIPATFKTPLIQMAALALLVACLFYYTWVYYIAPKR